MKHFFTLLFLLLGPILARAATYYTFNGGGIEGNWSDVSTWTTDPTGSTYVGAAVPANGDAVVITNGYTVQLTANVATTGLTITIQSGGTLNLSTYEFTSTLTALGGQGTLRIQKAYFPAVTTNNFDDANTGTVEYYDFAAASTDLSTAANYNNLRFVNTTAASYEARLNKATTTIAGTLTLARSSTGGVDLAIGSTASTNRTVSIAGNVQIGQGCQLLVTSGTGQHTVTFSGSVTNNGSILLHTDATNFANATFQGNSDNTLACNGPTEFNRFTLNKGTGSLRVLSVTSTLTEATSGAAAPNGNLRLRAIGGGDMVILTNGTLKLGTNIKLTRLSNSSSATNYDVGSSSNSPCLWIAGAEVSIDNNQALVVYGLFRISAGSFSSMGAQGAVIREDGRYQLEGGILTTTKFRPSTTSPNHRGSFAISGGELRAIGTTSDNDYARFSLPFKDQSFTMTGGTITVRNPETGGFAVNGGYHVGVKEGNYVVTGGNVNVEIPAGNLVTSAGNPTNHFGILSTAPIWDLKITRLGTSTGAARQAVLIGINTPYPATTTTAPQPLVILDSLLITGANTPTLNARGYQVNVAGTFAIGTGTQYLTGSNVTRFYGAQNQSFLLNGTIGDNLYDLTVEKTAGTLLLGGSAGTFTVSHDLKLLDGVLDDGGKTLLVARDILNSASHTSSTSSGSITLNGTVKQWIGGDGSGVFGNLTLNNTVAAGTVAAEFNAAQAVSGVLTLTSNNILDISTHRLSITSVSNAAIMAPGGFSSTRMIRTSGNQSDGGLRKTYGAPGSFLFPVGTGSKYTPATITLAVAPTAYGKVNVAPVNAQNPFVTNPALALNYYWKVTSLDFTGLQAGSISSAFQGLTADAPGLVTSPMNYVPGRYQPTQWQSGTTSGVTAAGANLAIAFANQSSFNGEFTAGDPSAFNAVTAYYSLVDNGDWDTPASWSTTGYNGAPASTTPSASTPVFIGNNRTIKISANTRLSGSLEIEAGATLDVQSTTGHNFGSLPETEVGGSGTLRISTAGAVPSFPGGDFATFLGPQGGTVEYYTDGTSPSDFTLPTTSVTSLAIASYRNLVLNAGAGRTITLPATNLQIYNDLSGGTLPGFDGLTLLSAATAGNLVVAGNLSQQRGTLRFSNTTARTVAVDGNVSVSSGATFDVDGGGATVANLLTIGGSLVNNGTFSLDNGTAYSNVTFLGSANQSITGATGVLTRFKTLTVNKGSSATSTLTLNVAGTLTTPTADWLTLSNGTLVVAKAGQTLFLENGSPASFTIPATAGLTVNATGAVLNVVPNDNNASDLLLAGQLTITAGTVNVGNTASPGTAPFNDLEYTSASVPAITVEANGVLNVNGQIRRSLNTTAGALRYVQNGGMVTVFGRGASQTTNRERGIFEVMNTGSIFRMLGGTLSLRRSNGHTTIADLYLHPDSTLITGGTIALGNTAAGVGNVAVSVDSNVPLYDMQVEAGADATNTNTAILRNSPLTLTGSLTIGNVNSVFNANSLDVAIGRNLTNGNTTVTTGVAAGGYRPGIATQTTTFNGGILTQTISGVSGGLTNFGNLVLNHPQPGGTLSLAATTNLRVNNRLTLTEGTLSGGANTITVTGEVANSATYTSSGTGAIVLEGSSNQTLSGDGTGVFGNLTLNNGSGATTTATQEITGILTFLGSGSRILTIGSQLLKLTNPLASGAIVNFGTTRYISTNGIVADAGVVKSYASTGGSFTFPVGSVGKYRPAVLNVTTAGAAGTITVKPINAPHPATTDALNKELSYYWKLSSTGFSNPTVTHTYTYANTDVSGTEASYIIGRFYPALSTWIKETALPASINTTANTATLTRIGDAFLNSDYTLGESSEFNAVQIFYSRTSTAGLPGGSAWNDPASWTFDTGGADPVGPFTAVPTGANPVVILAGHLITNSGSGAALGRQAASLLLQGTLNLDATTANNFGTVSGTGQLVIGSAVFPAGNYNALVSPTGGTVEYTAAVTLPARSVYNNLLFSGATTKNLSNVDLSISGDFTITGGSVNNLSDQDITLTAPTALFSNAGTFSLNNGSLTTAGPVSNSGTLNLNQGVFTVGTSLTNAGTLNAGSDELTVGTSLTNTGAFTAAAGPLLVNQSVVNTGSFTTGTGTLTVSGALSNNSGGVFVAGDGSIEVAGNFSNAGTYSANANQLLLGGDFTNTNQFNAGSGSTALSGNWTNNGTFVPGASTVLFNTLVDRALAGNTTFSQLQKAGPAQLLFGPATNVTVENLLTLTQGRVVTGSSNTLVLTNRAIQPVLGQSETAYVEGRLLIHLPDALSATRIFPLGNGAGIYRPVTIGQGAASSLPNVQVEMFDMPAQGTVPGTLANISQARYYSVQLLSGSIASPTVQLSFNTNGVADEQVNVPGNLRIARTTGTPTPASAWTDAGGSGVFTPAAPAGYALSAPTSLTAATYFSLASTNTVDNPLPVELVRFTAQATGATVQLNWVTASETNNAYFVVERSLNGRDFTDLMRVAGNGTTAARHAYTAVDARPYQGLAYYRLRQVDLDGRTAYSEAVTVQVATLARAAFQAFPNPTSGTQFTVRALGLQGASGTLRISDSFGRVVQELPISLTQPQQDITVQPTTKLVAGVYLVSLQTASGRLVQRLVVE